ncbi:MAG TPA: sigma-70 family RNA polymerase sigma factor [Pirellulales bacterium]|nr:sigma-70 family RNA polymerase sigma factor [Pirellulales bacterium]
MSHDSQLLLDRFRQGDDGAAAAIFDRYAARLVALARSRLSPRLAVRLDAEDIVQSVYRSFFVRARAGEFTADHEGDLWRLLAAITLHKLWRQAKHHRRNKRATSREVATTDAPAFSPPEFADRQPSVVDILTAADELRWLFRQLEPVQRQAVELRLEDKSVAEVASALGRSERTIRRWLADAKELLGARWQSEQARLSDTGPASQPSAFDPAAPLRHADYHLEALLGAGATAKVYAATHRQSGQRVALKVLRKRLHSRPHLVERFVREAQIVARFDHPHIVRVHGLGRLPDGGYFIAMDLVDGSDLAGLCETDPVSPARAAEIVAAVATAVNHAHGHGVIHRDLKPGNVLVDRRGRPLVTDFGFAWTEADIGQATIAGTAGFMAPEQCQPALGEISPATDVYGLGALLMMLCCGHPPEPAESTIQINDGRSEPISPIAGLSERSSVPVHVPATLRAVWQRCLARNPRDRYQSAADVAAALRGVYAKG